MTGESKQEKGGIWQYIKLILISLLIVIPIRVWIAQPFIVNGASMEPTFHNGEYLIVDELTYQFKKPQKGDVVIFRYPFDPSKFFIKRITGLPGETVKTAEGEIRLGENEYFVEGDNRRASYDSRIWGPLEEKFIIGRPIVRLFPLNRISILPGEEKESKKFLTP